jgi:hypothetical protein
MKDAVLSALFKIPDPITADEFSRRPAKRSQPFVT